MYFNYQDFSLKSGIYEIRNRISNKSYIGQASRFKTRFGGHKQTLFNNKHSNKHFQSSYNFYLNLLGHDNFIEFHILEVMTSSTKEKRNVREEYWINKYLKSGYQLYNKNLKPTKESKHNSKFNIKKRSERMLGNKNPMFGKTGLKNPMGKKYNNIQLLSADGKLYTCIFGLHKFCREHDLVATKLCAVLSGRRKSHKGWKLVSKI